MDLCVCAGARFSRHRRSSRGRDTMVGTSPWKPCCPAHELALALQCCTWSTAMGEPLRAVLALQSSAWQTMAGGGALWTSLSRRLWLWKVSCGLTVLQLHWNAACRPVYLWLPGVALRKEIICPYCLPEQASSLRERDLDRWSCHRRSSAMCRNWQRWASGVASKYQRWPVLRC